MRRAFQDERITYIIGDVRDKDALFHAARNANYIFHLAALKHVPVCEDNPWEAVKTNIIGTQNVIEAAIKNGVKKVIDISTDKAVDPYNLYGITKACGEKLMIAANTMTHTTRFVCIRGGNVLGTTGSVVPLFREQIQKLNELTLTDRRMTRFFMRVEEAIGLVLDAALHSIGGEIFVMKMPACKITDLAAVMIQQFGDKKTQVRTTGIRPGEKIFEVLVSKYEAPRAYSFGKYFIILPHRDLKQTNTFYINKKLRKIQHPEFTSQNTTILSREKIKHLLKRDGWFENHPRKDALNYLKTLGAKDLKNFFASEGWK